MIGPSRAKLGEAVAALGLPAFRARQIWHWFYHHGARQFEDMTTLAKPVRAQLAEHFTIGRPEVAVTQLSEDGTRKWLMRYEGAKEAETVFIPEEDRGALCVPAQVGCTPTCAFCQIRPARTSASACQTYGHRQKSLGQKFNTNTLVNGSNGGAN